MDGMKQTVFSVTSRIVNGLSAALDTSSGKAMLAKLRHSTGRPMSETIEVWPIVFDYLPEKFLGTGVRVTAEEMAILTTLQLYALHQQGNKENVILNNESEKWHNIGYSLSALRTDNDRTASDRRFNALVTSTTFEELSHHLRQMLKLLKAKTNAKIDYAKLAEDLYWFIRGYEDGIRLDWARAYYSIKVKGDQEHD